MKTNFFTQISALNLTGNIRLNLHSQQDGIMAVSLLLIDESIKNKSANSIPPLLLKGSTEILDLKFFETISTPIQQTNEFLCNLKEHEQAIKNAQPANSKSSSAIAGKDGKKKKFDEQMKKVADLEKLNRIGEAIGQMPDSRNYPEYEIEIKTKMQQLRSKHGTLSLFGEGDRTAPAESTTRAESNQDLHDMEHSNNRSDEEDENFDNDEISKDDLDPNR